MKMRRGGGRTLTKERSYLTEGEKKIEDKRDFFFFFLTTLIELSLSHKLNSNFRKEKN